MQNLETPAKRVRYLRTLAGLSRKQLEEKYNLNYHTLQSWELGRNEITRKSAQLLCTVFREAGLFCSEEWLIYGFGALPTPYKDTSQETEINKNIDVLKIVDYYANNINNAVTVFLSESYFEPLYSCGSYVGGIMCYGKEIENIIGSVCIVGLQDGSVLVRKVLCGDIKRTYSLFYNCIKSGPSHKNINLTFAAKITFMIKMGD